MEEREKAVALKKSGTLRATVIGALAGLVVFAATYPFQSDFWYGGSDAVELWDVFNGHMSYGSAGNVPAYIVLPGLGAAVGFLWRLVRNNWR